MSYSIYRLVGLDVLLDLCPQTGIIITEKTVLEVI